MSVSALADAYTAWTAWTTCNPFCGHGTQTRQRACRDGGYNCPEAQDRNNLVQGRGCIMRETCPGETGKYFVFPSLENQI